VTWVAGRGGEIKRYEDFFYQNLIINRSFFCIEMVKENCSDIGLDEGSRNSVDEVHDCCGGVDSNIRDFLKRLKILWKLSVMLFKNIVGSLLGVESASVVSKSFP